MQAGGVPRDQPVAVELDEAVEDGAWCLVGLDGPADQAGGREACSVEQREDRVVLVVEAGQAGPVVQLLVGGADLVDPVKERELAQRVGDRPVGLGVGGRLVSGDRRSGAPGCR